MKHLQSATCYQNVVRRTGKGEATWAEVLEVLIIALQLLTTQGASAF